MLIPHLAFILFVRLFYARETAAFTFHFYFLLFIFQSLSPPRSLLFFRCAFTNLWMLWMWMDDTDSQSMYRNKHTGEIWKSDDIYFIKDTQKMTASEWPAPVNLNLRNPFSFSTYSTNSRALLPGYHGNAPLNIRICSLERSLNLLITKPPPPPPGSLCAANSIF